MARDIFSKYAAEGLRINRRVRTERFYKSRRKGSHRNFNHPLCSKIVTLKGKVGNDAQKYQIKQVKEAIDEVKSK